MSETARRLIYGQDLRAQADSTLCLKFLLEIGVHTLLLVFDRLQKMSTSV